MAERPAGVALRTDSAGEGNLLGLQLDHGGNRSQVDGAQDESRAARVWR